MSLILHMIIFLPRLGERHCSNLLLKPRIGLKRRRIQNASYFHLEGIPVPNAYMFL
jgi:hypothetical protein